MLEFFNILFNKFSAPDIKDNNVSSSLFKEEKEIDLARNACGNCENKDICKLTDSENYLCGSVVRQENYDSNKPSILLFDDNAGVVSFLEDDIIDLFHKKIIDKNKYNILTFSTQYAAFNLRATLKSYNGLNIKYAIFDLTIGGGIYDEIKGNIVLDGVDAYSDVLSYNPDLRFIFFTGNKLNPYINKNKEIMKKFSDISNKDIKDFIIYKTSLSPEQRREKIKELIKE